MIFFSIGALIYLGWVVSNRGLLVKKEILSSIFIVSIYPVFLFFIYNDGVRFLYAIRFFEYFLWFFIGLLVHDISRLILSLIIMLFFSLVFGSMLGADFGYFNYVWELSAFASFCSVFVLVTMRKTPIRMFFYLSFLSLIFLSAGQRTPIIATFLTLLYLVFSKDLFSKKIKYGVVFSILIGSVFLIFTENRFSNTLSDVFSSENFNSIDVIYNESKKFDTYGEFVYGDRGLVGDSGDLSFQLRIKKWSYAIKDMLDSPLSLIFGLGAGYFGGAADSSIARIFFEFGLIGLIAWVVFFINMMRVSFLIKILTVCFLLNAVFIDIVYSSRLMVIYLLVVGSVYFNSGGVVSRNEV